MDGNTLQSKSEVLPDSSGNELSTSLMCYRVKAMERNGNRQVSLSNIACVPIYPIAFLPNAFSPNNDGINDFYKPICAGLNGYIFEIYDRWGQLVYTDTPDSKGWDGTFRGKNAESGTYVFRLSAAGFLKSPATNDARLVERKGTLFLVR
jgi:gliding motility-associated-like protein